VQWHRAEYAGSFWPAFLNHAELKKPAAERTYRTREERFQMKSNYRTACMERHRDWFRRNPEGKKHGPMWWEPQLSPSVIPVGAFGCGYRPKQGPAASEIGQHQPEHSNVVRLRPPKLEEEAA
jgi:hypothetical protein